MKLNWVLNSYEEEIAVKVESMLVSSDTCCRELLALSRSCLSEDQEEKITMGLEFVKSLTSADARHPSIQAYMNHPVRVSTMLLKILQEEKATYGLIGLIHNVYEVGGVSEGSLIRAGFEEFHAKAIRLLTIDRSRQWNNEYLESYYKAIENFSQPLALVRCLDKLDNMLALQLIREEDNRALYLQLIQKFIVPLASRLSSDLGSYIGELCVYMQREGCNQNLASQYEVFKKEMIENERI